MEGSNERADELSKMPRPAKAPARPTVPIRSKSTNGTDASADDASNSGNSRCSICEESQHKRA